MKKTITIQELLDAHNSIFANHIDIKRLQADISDDTTIDTALEFSEAKDLISSAFKQEFASKIMVKIKLHFITEKEIANKTMEFAESINKNVKIITWIVGISFALSVLTALIISL